MAVVCNARIVMWWLLDQNSEYYKDFDQDLTKEVTKTFSKTKTTVRMWSEDDIDVALKVTFVKKLCLTR